MNDPVSAPLGTTRFTNARLVLADDVVAGDVTVENGLITAITPARGVRAASIDCDGDYLIPGLVELHTDNVERHAIPRPGTRWPSLAAIMAHDAEVTAAGITTVFDSLAVGEISTRGDRIETLREITGAIETARSQSLLKVDHFLHLRCEISYRDCPALFQGLCDDASLKLVSIMDHTPGQRQFISLDKYRDYYLKKFGFSDAEFDEFYHRQMENSATYGANNRATIVALSQARGITLASHDDATADHVVEAMRDGMAIAEFPTTMAAAEASADGGLGIMMGAPNLVRGLSHSGNISARSVAAAGLLDILSSDYVPSSLIYGAFLLHQTVPGWTLPRAIWAVSGEPATRVGLNDRGEIALGLKGDLVWVRDTGTVPLIRGVWRAGERVG